MASTAKRNPKEISGVDGVLVHAPEIALKARIDKNRTGRTRHEARSRHEDDPPLKTMHSPVRIDRIHTSIELRGATTEEMPMRKCGNAS